MVPNSGTGHAPSMVRIGYTMMTEQADPRQLVRDVVHAERVGFDFSVISDHYFPWLDSQGHASYAWAVLGAAAQATSRIPLMTYVTCPSFRYHPAVVAQKAATVQLLSQGRFRLGLGSGENLNEHIVGGGWPAADIRLERLAEAIEIIRALFEGGYVNHRGKYFDVESAKLWDLPQPPPPIGVAVSGRRSCEIAGRLGDLVIAVEPEAGLLREFGRSGGAGKPAVGQLPVCYDPDRSRAVARAHDQFRWFGGGWKVNSELPGTAAFALRERLRAPRGRRRVDPVRRPCGGLHRSRPGLRHRGIRRGGPGPDRRCAPGAVPGVVQGHPAAYPARVVSPGAPWPRPEAVPQGRSGSVHPQTATYARRLSDIDTPRRGDDFGAEGAGACSGGIHADQRKVHLAPFRALQQGLEHPGVPPPPEAVVDRRPGPEPLRHLPPPAARPKPPDHALELSAQPLGVRSGPYSPIGRYGSMKSHSVPVSCARVTQHELSDQVRRRGRNPQNGEGGRSPAAW